MKAPNLVSRCAVLFAVVLFGLVACGKSAADRPCSSVPALPASPAISHYTYEVIATWPHDPKAFTQGLLFYHGSLLESTGRLYGQSSTARSGLEDRAGREAGAGGGAVFCRGADGHRRPRLSTDVAERERVCLRRGHVSARKGVRVRRRRVGTYDRRALARPERWHSPHPVSRSQEFPSRAHD